MGKETLIIVESNGKTKKIEKFTGHQCIASLKNHGQKEQ